MKQRRLLAIERRLASIERGIAENGQLRVQLALSTATVSRLIGENTHLRTANMVLRKKLGLPL